MCPGMVQTQIPEVCQPAEMCTDPTCVMEVVCVGMDLCQPHFVGSDLLCIRFCSLALIQCEYLSERLRGLDGVNVLHFR